MSYLIKVSALVVCINLALAQLNGYSKSNTLNIVDNYIKGLFASVETSGDTKGDYVQLQKSTFYDLKQRKLIPNDITWEKVKRYPHVYDQVAEIYLQDLLKTHKIPTTEDAVIWSLRPSWYQKYEGNIDKIPDDIKSSKDKSVKRVMQQRLSSMQQYLERINNATNTADTTE